MATSTTTASTSTTIPPMHATSVIDPSILVTRSNVNNSTSAPEVVNVTDVTPVYNENVTQVYREHTVDLPITFCPPVGIQHGFYDDNIILSTRSRDVGTVVHISCRAGSRLKGPDVLKCEDRGHWNGSRPHCEIQGGPIVGIPMSTQLLIGVLSGCCGLVVIVVAAIICRLMCCKPRDKLSGQESEDATIDSYQGEDLENPYFAVERERQHRAMGNDSGSVHYAKPEIHSTFINPSFYEDVYARWRSREDITEVLYDTPFQFNRRLQDQMKNPELKWSTLSLRAHDNYDYGKYGKIPRSQLVSEADDTSVDGLTTF
ncbi:uncharacterized protein LOC121373824 isoform X2 [Gigantopelta aegis]|uniref:uncharacterized protein LOC121373824 isoform X2 n=1 Tax=Gigantopelta aegis TaxID=1735272 RepID=UPI001B88C1C8|nr:uncharacterized protein LOC121373824 isoform X2 [Gigantopelta aegis]